jgi:hypothetical protein
MTASSSPLLAPLQRHAPGICHLEPVETDHDEGEQVAMAAHYAAEADLRLPAVEACFPCGRTVPPGARQWSPARGWRCAADACFPLTKEINHV